MARLVTTTVPFPPPEVEESWQGASLPAGAPALWHPRRVHFDALWACTHGKGSRMILCCLIIDSPPLESGCFKDHGEWDGKTPITQFDPFGHFRPLSRAKDPFP